MNKNAMRTLIAAGTASLALVAAGPVSAETKTAPPPAKKDCTVSIPKDANNPAEEWSVPHGTKMTLKAPDGRQTTYTCKDGSWVKNVVDPRPLVETITPPPGAIVVIG